ncbi:unnamed protein product [Calicophoron daubneyi]|uniref:UBC core domain-containing protein n=1 Tax=Calicophoron daubneyi TaxID=300641 RepID=A0AAV2T3A8_CALDB
MTYNTRNPAVKRLLKEAQELAEPTELFYARPLEDNLFEWHFTIRGPEDTEFAGGIYHGRILLPSEYPMKPPNIVLLTPNGRFETHRKICLSISGYHPESWRPSWSVRTALLAIIGFMPTHGAGAIGSLDQPADERRALARRSQSYVCETCGPIAGHLRPLTAASRSFSEEAVQAASQIAMSSEGGSNKKHCSKEEDKTPANSISTSSVNPTVSSEVEMKSQPSVLASSPVASSVETPKSTDISGTGSASSSHETCIVSSGGDAFGSNNAALTSNFWGSPNPMITPPQVHYWLCYPVYYSFPPNYPLFPGVNTQTSSAKASTSLSTMATNANGERVPLSFTEWLEQIRGKRNTVSNSEPNSLTEPASAPLTRAVVTNSSSCLYQRASASFKVHRNPSADAVVGKANSTCPSISEDAVVRSSVADAPCSVAASAPVLNGNLDEEGKVIRDPSNPHPERPESAATTEQLSEILADGDERAKTGKTQNSATPAKRLDRGEYTVKEGTPSCSTQESKTGVDDTSSIQHPRIAFSKSAVGVVLPPKTEDMPPLDTAETNAIPQKSEVAGVNSSELCGRSRSTPVEAPTPTDVDCSLVKTSSVPEVVTNSRSDAKEDPGLDEATSQLRSLSEKGTEATQPEPIQSPSISRPPSRTSHSASGPLTPSPQYRAATVCAAGVAVALFLVVMRRLALMLHGV